MKDGGATTGGGGLILSGAEKLALAARLDEDRTSLVLEAGDPRHTAADRRRLLKAVAALDAAAVAVANKAYDLAEGGGGP